MGGEWREVSLGQIAEDLTVGHVGSMAAEYVAEGIPFLRSQNIEPFRLDFTDVKYISAEFHNKLRKSALLPGDVVIVRTGKPGTAAVVPDSIGDLNCSDLVIVRPGKNLDSRFLCYFINGVAQHHVDAHLVGAVQQHFNVGAARQLPLKLPPLDEQRAIAHILGTLDDKIELNRRTNETLEAMARALFESWFVDFDPVRAKAQGQTPPGMDPATAALFPSEFENSELGEIPKGWTVEPLGDVADVNWGDTSTTKKSYAATGFVAYSAKGPDGLLPYHDFDRTGVVVSAIGANAGATWLARGKWSCIKNTIRFWSTRDGVPTEYLFQATAVPGFWPRRGSAQPFIAQGDARAVRVVVPSGEVGAEYERSVSVWHERVDANAREVETLARIRDALLPRLLSGELSVAQAEQAVEATA